MVNRKRNARSTGYKSTRKVSKTKSDEEPAKKSAKDSPEPSGEEYEVEKILGKRYNNGTEEFLIKWNNYSYTENTWEPIEHLDGCDAAMEAFRVCTLVCYEFSDFSHKWWQNGPKAIRTVPIKPATEDNDDSS